VQHIATGQLVNLREMEWGSSLMNIRHGREDTHAAGVSNHPPGRERARRTGLSE
jgi:hypothetical protein